MMDIQNMKALFACIFFYSNKQHTSYKDYLPIRYPWSKARRCRMYTKNIFSTKSLDFSLHCFDVCP